MKTAWVIDDDSEMGYTIQLMLQGMGFAAKTFEHPREPVRQMLDGTVPDLIVLDMHMPGVTGIEVLGFIRSRPQWRQVAIVMLSVETADVLVHQALESGADGYVFKPMTLEELSEAIIKALRQRTAPRTKNQ